MKWNHCFCLEILGTRLTRLKIRGRRSLRLSGRRIDRPTQVFLREGCCPMPWIHSVLRHSSLFYCRRYCKICQCSVLLALLPPSRQCLGWQGPDNASRYSRRYSSSPNRPLPVSPPKRWNKGVILRLNGVECRFPRSVCLLLAFDGLGYMWNEFRFWWLWCRKTSRAVPWTNAVFRRHTYPVVRGAGYHWREDECCDLRKIYVVIGIPRHWHPEIPWSNRTACLSVPNRPPCYKKK